MLSLCAQAHSNIALLPCGVCAKSSIKMRRDIKAQGCLLTVKNISVSKNFYETLLRIKEAIYELGTVDRLSPNK